MRTTRRSSSWFGQLRRERGLFALVGSLLLLLGTLQPPAFAQPAGDGSWAICQGMAVQADAGSETDIPGEECPTCIAGLCATTFSPVKALVAAAIAHAPAGLDAAPVVFRRDTEGRSERAVDHTAIRAPPAGS